MPTTEIIAPAEAAEAIAQAVARTRYADVRRWSAAKIAERLHVSLDVAERLADRTTKWRLADIARAAGVDRLTPKQWRNKTLRAARRSVANWEGLNVAQQREALWTAWRNMSPAAQRIALPPEDLTEGRDPVWLAGPLLFWLMTGERVFMDTLEPTYRNQPRSKHTGADSTAAPHGAA